MGCNHVHLAMWVVGFETRITYIQYTTPVGIHILFADLAYRARSIAYLLVEMCCRARCKLHKVPSHLSKKFFFDAQVLFFIYETC